MKGKCKNADVTLSAAWKLVTVTTPIWQAFSSPCSRCSDSMSESLQVLQDVRPWQKHPALQRHSSPTRQPVQTQQAVQALQALLAEQALRHEAHFLASAAEVAAPLLWQPA